MALKVDGIAFEFFGAAPEEMVEANFVEGGRGSERGDMAADIVLYAIGTYDHGQGVPTDKTLNAALEFLITGITGFQAMRDGVGVGSVCGEG